MKHLTEIIKKQSGTFLFAITLFIALGTIIYFTIPSFRLYLSTNPDLLNKELLFFIMVGFLAQMIDGALGMAYGATSNSLLMSLGVPPASASACIHLAEVFTTGASGLSHLRFGNVNKKLFYILVIPGVIGAILGAYILTNIDGKIIKPFISIYLIFLAFIILRKALNKPKPKVKTERIGILALFGGFMDSIGGGGWGPIVTSTLISQGREPKYTIGSVSITEFFVAFASSLTFLVTIGFSNWQVIAGLILGGVVAAPLAAYSVGFIKPKKLMIIVSIVITLVSIKNIYSVWF